MLIGLERGFKMNILRTALMIALLLTLAIAAGCQEGQAGKGWTSGRQLVIEPSQTGFWETKFVYVEPD